MLTIKPIPCIEPVSTTIHIGTFTHYVIRYYPAMCLDELPEKERPYAAEADGRMGYFVLIGPFEADPSAA
jgi:hypothetical protein